MTIEAKKQLNLPMPLRKIRTAFTNPNAFFRQRSNIERTFYHSFSRFAHLKIRASRRQAPANSNIDITMKDDDGYAIF